MLKPTQDGSEFTAFRVPTNATVLDSWVEISNDSASRGKAFFHGQMTVGPRNNERNIIQFTRRDHAADDFSVDRRGFDDGNYTIEMPSDTTTRQGLECLQYQEFSSSQGVGTSPLS